MPSIDLDKMREIVDQNFSTKIAQAFGDEGTSALRLLTRKLTELYKFVEPAHFNEGLVVFCRLDKTALHSEIGLPEKSLRQISGPENLSVEIGLTKSALEVKDSGEIAIWNVDGIDLESLSKYALVYVLEAEKEVFVVGGEKASISNPFTSGASVFAIPTFGTLREALEDFKAKAIRASGCEHFSQVWKSENRIFFKQKPEGHMRKSLHHHLRSALRDVEVRPEQIVDESHPVDIKVTWAFSNRLALIEIKWLGDSVDDNFKITTPYRDQRARDGAKQLAEYLDANHAMATNRVTVGYLVVIDARRKGTKDGVDKISRDDGFAYEENEIDFNPAYHEFRTDFEQPYRMFTEPVCAQS